MKRHYCKLCALCTTAAAICAVVFVNIHGDAAAQTADEEIPSWELPWALREHFSFTVQKGTINYAADNGDWQVTVEDAGAIIEKAGFEIAFTDGAVLNNVSLGKATAHYERFTDTLGKGMLFTATFPPKEGLHVQHSMSVNSDHPFVLVTLRLQNDAEKPIEISRVTCVKIGAEGITHLTPGADLMARHVSFRGACPVFDKNAPAGLAIFNDPERGISLCLGALSQGIGAARVEFIPRGDRWQGEVVCEYDPPIRLASGETLQSNPIWMAVGLPDPVDIDVLNAWTVSLHSPAGKGPLERVQAAKETLRQYIPRSWVTTEEGASFHDLVRSVSRWGAAKPQGVLVPITWEGRPGSLEGAVPRYPKNMGKVASELQGLGAKAGLTVDPLLTEGGNPGWTAPSADGRHWLNLRAPEARRHAVERMQKVGEWGFDFFAVAPSGIPAENLRHFNMTRVQADQLAFAVMVEAAGNRPIIPTSAYTAKADLELWLEVAASSSCMATYGIMPGPVRLDLHGVHELSAELLTALSFFDGPVEFVDRATPKVERALGWFFPQYRFNERPIDAAKRPPRIWYVSLTPPDAEYRPGAVAMFAGARAWTVDELDSEIPVRVWRAADGAFLDAGEGPVPAADHFTLYGVMPVLGRPVLMGASGSAGLLMDDMPGLSWDAEKGRLAGTFSGRHRHDATAYVHIPEGWVYDSGKTGETAIRKKNVRDRIAFPVEAGKPVHFEFEFERE